LRPALHAALSAALQALAGSSGFALLRYASRSYRADEPLPAFLFTRGRGAKVSWIRKTARKNKKPGCLFSDPGLVRLYWGEF
jgi:hypothetical protein